jgi:DNA repair exonuclease SbcCD ATPase subunit
MLVSTTALMIAGEVLLVVLAGCVFLIMQNRRLRALSTQLQNRMGELVVDLRETRAQQGDPSMAASSTTATTSGAVSYAQALERQLSLTRQYHQQLAAGHDIALDLDSETPAPRRAAALRYALLVAERDAQGEKTEEVPNWEKLAARYEQLLEYYDSGEPVEESPGDSVDIEVLRKDLQTYKKRVLNLEKFKKLYFELEERMESCSEKANTHFNELSEFASQVDEPQRYEEILGRYHSSYNDVSELMERENAAMQANSASARAAQQASGEIRHLRNITADQHRLIYELQKKLEAAATQEENNEVVRTLQEELSKQLRYAQESETCIQLLEDELNNAHREAEQARSKVHQFGLMKAENKDLQATRDKQEKLILALKNDSKRLKRKLRALEKLEDTKEMNQELQQELSRIKVKYAELEERYLDLKLKN